MKYAPVSKILEAKHFYAANPEGELYLGFGFGYWTKADFYRWFNECLNLKCGGKPETEQDRWQKADARVVEDYKRGVKRSGCNILQSKLYKTMYPHIDNPPHEY